MDNSIKQVEQNMPEYWEGPKNFLVRMYAYLQIGFAETNNAKVVVAAIWGLYLLFNFKDPMWVFVMGGISVPLLILVGHFKLYKVSKPAEYPTTSLGTVLGYNSFNNQVHQTQLLEEILKELKNETSNHGK